MFFTMYNCNYVEQNTQKNSRRKDGNKRKPIWYRTKEPEFSKTIIKLYALSNVYDNICP